MKLVHVLWLSSSFPLSMTSSPFLFACQVNWFERMPTFKHVVKTLCNKVPVDILGYPCAVQLHLLWQDFLSPLPPLPPQWPQMGQGRTLNSGLPPVTTSVKLIGQLAGVHSCFHFFTVSLKAGKDENHPMQKNKPESFHLLTSYRSPSECWSDHRTIWSAALPIWWWEEGWQAKWK